MFAAIAGLTAAVGMIQPPAQRFVSELAPFAPDVPALAMAAALSAALVGGYALFANMDQASPASPWLAHIVVGLLLVHVGFLAISVARNLGGDLPFTGTEGIISLSTLGANGVLDIYSPEQLTAPPFSFSLYGPGYYAVLDALSRGFGSSPVVGRALSAVSIAAIAAMLVVAVPRAAGRPGGRYWPTLLFLFVLPTMAWRGTLSHPVFLAAALSLACVLVYARKATSGDVRWLAAAAGLAAAGLLVRQTAFVAPAAIVMHLLMHRRYRAALQFSALVAMTWAAVFAALVRATDGGIWLMAFRENAIGLDVTKVLPSFGRVIVSPFTALAVVAAIIVIVNRRKLPAVESLASLYFVLSLAWFLLSSARPGSGFHYFAQAATSGCLLLGLVGSRAMDDGHLKSVGSGAVVLITAAVLGVPTQIGTVGRWSDLEADEQRVTSALAGVRLAEDEYVLTDPEYAYPVTRAGYRLLVNDPFIYSMMTRSGVMGEPPYMSTLRAGRVPVALLGNSLAWHHESDIWGPDVVAFLASNYVCASRDRGTYGAPDLVVCEWKPS